MEKIAPEGKLAGVFKRIFLRQPHERAVYEFTTSILKRSSLHRFRLGGFLAIGTALAILIWLEGNRVESKVIVLALQIAPMHLLFIVALVGLWVIMEIPMESESNWVFRIAADERTVVYRSAVIKAAVVRVMLPVAIIGGIFHWLAGEAHFALIHVVFAFAVSFFILEVVFLHFHKIPFTCSYLPGKANLKTFAGPYLLAFLLYLTVVTVIELCCLSSPVAMSITIFLLLVAAGVLHWAGRWRKDEGLQFFEEPDPVMLSLEIDHN